MAPSTVSSKKTALITEASNTIGSELARLFAQDGYNLVLVSTNTAPLKKLCSELEEKYKIYIKTIGMDLSEKDASSKLYFELKKEQIRIDALVNNLEFNVSGSFTEISNRENEKLLEANILFPAMFTHRVMADMEKNQGGKILNVSSFNTLNKRLNTSLYSASKAFMLQLSEMLADEYKKSSITVTVLCPSRETIFNTSNLPEKLNLKLQNDIEAAAKEGYDGMKKGRKMVIPSKQNKVVAFGSRILSGNTMRYFTRMVKSGK